MVSVCVYRHSWRVGTVSCVRCGIAFVGGESVVKVRGTGGMKYYCRSCYVDARGVPLVV